MNAQPNKEAYKITPLVPEQKRDWSLVVNGEEIHDVESVTLVNTRLNMSVDYGMRPEGYDGFVIRELGGAVTIPYTMDLNGQIYIGLVNEYRPTTGEKSTLNVPRGMTDLGEDHKTTAERELAEETGYRLQKIGKRVVQLASNLNVNSSLFDNSREENQGVSVYGVRVESDELVLNHDDDGSLFYSFPNDTTHQAESDTSELIYGSKFVPLAEAAQSKDMFTVSAVGLLVVQLLTDGNSIAPQNRHTDNNERPFLPSS